VRKPLGGQLGEVALELCDLQAQRPPGGTFALGGNDWLGRDDRLEQASASASVVTCALD
jgi:hypothetical protein